MPFIPDDDSLAVAPGGVPPHGTPGSGPRRQVFPIDTSPDPRTEGGRMTGEALNALPALLSLIPAAATGGLGSIGLSGLFAAGGEGIRQNALRIPGLASYTGQAPPATPQDAAMRMGISGAEGAVGQAIPVVANSLGRGFLTSALHPESQMQLETAIRNRVPVGPGAFPWSRTGGEMVGAGLEGPSRVLNNAIQAADAAGITIPRKDVLADLERLYQNAATTPTAEEQAGAFRDILTRMRQSLPPQMKPSEVQAAKAKMYELLKAQYAKVQGGNPIALTPLDNARNQAREAVASGARRVLEGIGGGSKGSLGHAIGTANRQMAPLLDLGPSVGWEEAGLIQRANPGSAAAPNVQTLNGRPPQPVALNFAHGGIDLPMLLAGNNPAIASRIGLGLTHPVVQGAAALAPRAVMPFLNFAPTAAAKFHIPTTAAKPDVLSQPDGFIPD